MTATMQPLLHHTGQNISLVCNEIGSSLNESERAVLFALLAEPAWPLAANRAMEALYGHARSEGVTASPLLLEGLAFFAEIISASAMFGKIQRSANIARWARSQLGWASAPGTVEDPLPETVRPTPPPNP